MCFTRGDRGHVNVSLSISLRKAERCRNEMFSFASITFLSVEQADRNLASRVPDRRREMLQADFIYCKDEFAFSQRNVSKINLAVETLYRSRGKKGEGRGKGKGWHRINKRRFHKIVSEFGHSSIEKYDRRKYLKFSFRRVIKHVLNVWNGDLFAWYFCSTRRPTHGNKSVSYGLWPHSLASSRAISSLISIRYPRKLF